MGFLPLMVENTGRHAAFGVFLSLVSILLYREMLPFISSFTNILAVVSQYVILLTFGWSLVIYANLLSGMNQLVFGAILIASNLVLLGMVIFVGINRQVTEIQSRRDWENVLTTQEIEIVRRVMDNETPSVADDQGTEMRSLRQRI